MRSPYYTNDDLESLINDLDNETENSMKVALKTILLMLKEIRDYQKKPLFNWSKFIFSHDKRNMGYTKRKVHTTPTDNAKDIIVGLHKQGALSDKDFQETRRCNCPLCRDGK